jgi:hypothetical protein
MERAYPVLISPGVDAVRRHEAEGQRILTQLWIQQVSVALEVKTAAMAS